MILEVIEMCINYLNEVLNEEMINELINSGPCYYNETPCRYIGIVNQIDFYIDYSKMMPVSIIQIECEDFFNEKINHPLVVYLDRCNQYTQKIFKNLGMSFDHRLVPQFKRLVGCELIFDVAWLDEKQSLIVDARLMKCDSRLNDKVVAHLGKLDAPIILDKIDCDLLDPNSLVNQLVKTKLDDYVDDWDVLDESYYAKVANQLF